MSAQELGCAHLGFRMMTNGPCVTLQLPVEQDVKPSIRSTPSPPFFSFRWPEKRLLTLLATTKKTMANREDLLDLVGKVEPRTVLLSHGEADSLTWFTAQIHARYPKINIVQPKPGVAVEV